MYKFQTHQLCSLLFCLNVHNVSSLSLSLPSLSHSSFATRQDLAVNVFKRSVEKNTVSAVLKNVDTEGRRSVAPQTPSDSDNIAL